MTGIPKKQEAWHRVAILRTAGGRPFAEREKRTLAISVAGSLEPVVGEKQKPTTDHSLPTTIRIEAEHKRTERLPTHQARFYELVAGSQEPVAGEKEKLTTDYRLPATIRVQLNHGKPADDAERLISIAEDFLSPEPEEAPGIAGGLNAEKLSDTGGISPSSAGGL